MMHCTYQKPVAKFKKKKMLTLTDLSLIFNVPAFTTTTRINLFLQVSLTSGRHCWLVVGTWSARHVKVAEKT